MKYQREFTPLKKEPPPLAESQKETQHNSHNHSHNHDNLLVSEVDFPSILSMA